MDRPRSIFPQTLTLSFALSLLALTLADARSVKAAPPLPSSALILHVDYVDAPGAEFDPTELETAWNVVGTYLNEVSYGQVSLTPEATSVIRMPETKAYYLDGLQSGDVTLLDAMSDVLRSATAAGYQIENYDFHVLMSDLKQGGVGSPGQKVFASHTGFGLSAHEIIHSMDTKHSNAWRAFGGSVIGAGEVIEYGNPFDVMGIGTYGTRSHLNVRLKHKLGWLPEANVLTVTGTGTYRIQAHDLPLAGGPAALRIKRNEDSNYWVEFRQQLTENLWTSEGALIHWGFNDWQYWGALETQQTLLLDMRPGSEEGLHDAALTPGGHFVDPEAGIEIRVIGKGGTTPETLDIEVVLSEPRTPIDEPAVITVLEPTNNVTSYSGTVTLEATASDPDAGTANGDGIDAVEFQLFNGGGEFPILVSGPLTTPPYRWDLDTTTLDDTGFALVVRATSSSTSGGHFNSVGAFFLVDNVPTALPDERDDLSSVESTFRLRISSNPGTDQRTISFQTPRAGAVHLRLVDLSGRTVKTLIHGELQSGPHRVSLVENSESLPAGTYFVLLQAQGTGVSTKMTVLR